jgi:SWI/SNF-related matrix-associated actin-dependent regulator of chromatin subfamily A3
MDKNGGTFSFHIDWFLICNFSSYRHSITKLLLPQRPPETGGGVLADTMGLGKTLSVLAIVAKSMDEARAWEKDEEQALSKNIPDTKKSSRATLVVVSSFRKLCS